MMPELAWTPEQQTAYLEEIEAELLRREQEQRANQGIRLADWYLGAQAAIDESVEDIKNRYHGLVAAQQTRRRVLQEVFGQAFAKQVGADLAKQGDKRKSVKYLTGKAGLRSRPGRLVVADKETAVEWAGLNCVDAVDMVLARVTPIQEYFEKTGEIPPGCEWQDEEERFFPWDYEQGPPRLTAPKSSGLFLDQYGNEQDRTDPGAIDPPEEAEKAMGEAIGSAGLEVVPQSQIGWKKLPTRDGLAQREMKP